MTGRRRVVQPGSRAVGTAALVALTGLLPGAVLAGAPVRPDLVERAVVLSQLTVQAGRSLRVTDTVRNLGGAGAPRSTTGYYISHDRTHRPRDRRLGARPLGSLPPRATSRGSTTLSIPVSLPPGSYRMLACADDRDRIPESNELNNCRATAQVLEVTRPPGADRTPPAFAGLKSATICIPGPVGGGRNGSYILRWDPATDNVTRSGDVVYDVYQASSPAGEDFAVATYTTTPGATSFTTPPLPDDKAFYFVVRARDRAGNREANRVERLGVNLCV